MATIRDGLNAVADDEVYGLLDYVDNVSHAIHQGFDGTLKISGDFDAEARGFSIGIRASEVLLVSAVTKVMQTLPEFPCGQQTFVQPGGELAALLERKQLQRSP